MGRKRDITEEKVKSGPGKRAKRAQPFDTLKQFKHLGTSEGKRFITFYTCAL